MLGFRAAWPGLSLGRRAWVVGFRAPWPGLRSQQEGLDLRVYKILAEGFGS